MQVLLSWDGGKQLKYPIKYKWTKTNQESQESEDALELDLYEDTYNSEDIER